MLHRDVSTVIPKPYQWGQNYIMYYSSSLPLLWCQDTYSRALSITSYPELPLDFALIIGHLLPSFIIGNTIASGFLLSPCFHREIITSILKAYMTFTRKSWPACIFSCLHCDSRTPIPMSLSMLLSYPCSV